MNNKSKKIYALLIFSLVLTIAILLVFNMGISAVASDTSVKVTGFWYSKAISFSEIESVNIYTGDFELGEKQSGMGMLGVHRGEYKNDMLGKYTCALNRNPSSVIVIRKTDGSTYVFNCKKAEHTSTVYQFIKDRVD